MQNTNQSAVEQPELIPVDSIDALAEENLWNEEIIDDVSVDQEPDLVVYSRDWTIATIINQIEQKNIDLNPAFQRRNAWDDGRRCKLIESLVAGLPVPEIVLAEDPVKKKAFIVIDGKQRLLTIAGFVDPTIDYWIKDELRNLKLRKDLNGKTYAQLNTEPALANAFREFMNADVRCTIISNFKTTDALYDIFYRLNTGSVPLSTQELRQVLHKGEFANYLISITNNQQPIQRVLGLRKPDPRLRDVEIVLRFIAIILFGNRYRGNLKKFLDEIMGDITIAWGEYEPKVANTYVQLNQAIENLTVVLGAHLIGRKFVNGSWETRFNKVLFEVEAYYFRLIPSEKLSDGKAQFVKGLQQLFEDSEFRSSVESTTKTNDRYELRFRRFQKVVNNSFGTTIDDVPIVGEVLE